MSETMMVTMEFKPMKGVGGGFRAEWVTAEGDEFEAGIDSGAGLGNGLLTFWFEKKGEKRRYWTAPIAEVLRSLIGQVAT